MVLIRPRLNDYHNLLFTQNEVDFAIPFLDEDIPLYVDPFLLWKSPSMQDNSLHTAITNSFNHLGYLLEKDKENDAINILIRASECDEVGLGLSATRKGLRIGENSARSILSLFKNIPQINKSGFVHFEEIQLFVDNISKDRISDIACNFMKSFLIDYTIQNANELNIPMEKVSLENIYNYKIHKFIDEQNVFLPVNPETKQPILFVPKRWLRFTPWLNYDNYYADCYAKEVLKPTDNVPNKVQILTFNRVNYDMVQNYIQERERKQADCKNDPLFNPIPVTSANRKLNELIALPSGKVNNADKKYEDLLFQLMASILYPHLDFAKEQSRTDSGVLIRDLIFYNNKSIDFLEEIYKKYDCQQIVMEIKNVKAIEREHINQLNRYLNEHFGRFGILITRNPLPKAMFQNTIDLWAGQRRCIIALTDEDIKMMVQLFETKQRLPIEVIKKKYIEFTRACPS